nr:hypothetical protein [Bacteroidota bacterium]
MANENIDDAFISLQTWESAMSYLAKSIIWFQHIENTLSICISAFSGMDEELGEIVTSEMSFRAKVAILSALATYKSKTNELHEDIQELIKRVRWAEQERNRLVHSMWDLAEDKPGSILREKASIRKSKHKVVQENFVPENLEELRNLFEGINTDLIYLFSEHFPEIEERLHY